MTADLNQDDRGKTVVYQNNRIGTVTDVQSGTAYVDPQLSNVPDQLEEELGWTDGDDYTIDEQAITAIGNGQLTLREDIVA